MLESREFLPFYSSPLSLGKSLCLESLFVLIKLGLLVSSGILVLLVFTDQIIQAGKKRKRWKGWNGGKYDEVCRKKRKEERKESC